MISMEKLEQELSALPLYAYAVFSPEELEFSDRIRWICEHECPMYGKTWACPPGVGAVGTCRSRCLGYRNCLMVATVTEVEDIANMEETLATRPAHEEVTNQAGEILRKLGAEPYILSTEACSICERCAILDGEACRYPDRMHPCVESHGINIIPVLERYGLEFQYGQNVVTWCSLLFY